MKEKPRKDADPTPECEDSLCSTDMENHIVRTDLYGTDRDPSYQEDDSRDCYTTMSPARAAHGGLTSQNVHSGAGRGQIQCLSSSAPTPTQPGTVGPEVVSKDGVADVNHTSIELVNAAGAGKQDSEECQVVHSTGNQNHNNACHQGYQKYSDTGSVDCGFQGVFQQNNMESCSMERCSVGSQEIHAAKYYGEGQPEYQGEVGFAVETGRQATIGSMEDSMAAEQLASELVQNFAGKNSHLISEMLERRSDQGFMFEGSGYERPPQAGQHYADYPAQQHVVQDVDLLNTPPQLPRVEDYPIPRGPAAVLGAPKASSTPEGFRQSRLNYADRQGMLTYNDIQPYGCKWLSGQSSDPPEDTHTSRDGGSGDNYPVHPQGAKPQGLWQPYRDCACTHTGQGYHGDKPSDHSNANAKQLKIDNLAFGRNQVGQGHHEVTQMTFTSREMMQNHLSQNYVYQKQTTGRGGQAVSDVDCSSIYPTREFIERSQCERHIKPQPRRDHEKPAFDGNLPPKKRHKSSKYSKYAPLSDANLYIPSMPIFEDSVSKYPLLMQGKENFGGSHKYFVVNPSDTKSMPSRTLLNKYIDFLILENEQITEISKSIAPPVDIYVTEDMYFMDSLKYNVPFPSKKFVEWVSSFYPKLNFYSMKFKGKLPVLHEGPCTEDPRPTQQVLEDTFYFFQREVMNLNK